MNNEPLNEVVIELYISDNIVSFNPARSSLFERYEILKKSIFI
jgi:hypothetical protein